MKFILLWKSILNLLSVFYSYLYLMISNNFYSKKNITYLKFKWNNGRHYRVYSDIVCFYLERNLERMIKGAMEQERNGAVGTREQLLFLYKEAMNNYYMKKRVSWHQPQTCFILLIIFNTLIFINPFIAGGQTRKKIK